MADYSILIIDDNEEDRYLLKRMLGLTGLSVTLFEKTDGSEAIEFLEDYNTNRALYPEDFPPTVLFLDVNMPIMDGWSFLKMFSGLRQRADFQSTVVVMFTSSALQEDRERAADYEFVRSYLVKGSYTADSLREVLIGTRANDLPQVGTP